jgi:hypothetical protein
MDNIVAEPATPEFELAAVRFHAVTWNADTKRRHKNISIEMLCVLGLRIDQTKVQTAHL